MNTALGVIFLLIGVVCGGPNGCKHCTTCNGSICSACNAGHYLNDGECLKCAKPCETCISASTCASCKPGHVFDLSGYCVSCDKHCLSCTSCQNGLYPDTLGNATSFCSLCDCNSCSQCAAGLWGASCVYTCSDACTDAGCDRNYGFCMQCVPCRYGHVCQWSCPLACVTNQNTNEACEQSNGTCKYGILQAGDEGHYCNQGSVIRATEGTTSVSSPKTSTSKSGDESSSVSWTATTASSSSASSSFSSSSSISTSGSLAKSEAEQQIKDSKSSGPLVGGLVGGVVVVLIVVVVTLGYVWIRRRRAMRQDDLDKSHSLSRSFNEVTGNEGSTGHLALYSVPNKVKVGDREKKDNRKSDVGVAIYENTTTGLDVPAVPPKIHAYLDDDLMEEIHEQDTDPTRGRVEDKYETYYNTSGLFRRKVAVDKLADFVTQKSDGEFETEFQRFADGLTRNYQEAIRKGNIKKNRYKKVYPYDATRVVLKIGSDDYINASYIDGYKRNHAYIATLGPTYAHSERFSLFWRMVWQEKVDTIVVLTKLMDGEKMKFERYWPDPGQKKTYGSIGVQALSEECYAEFTIRKFTITKGSRQKTVHQAHYTAWPDREVPDDVVSLLEFRHKVRTLPNRRGGPLVVHCSAGIGRTGTYIALDILIQEGLGDQSVDVYGCVNGLRGQRVNMVQNVDQYKYLHHALVHALTVDTGHVPYTTITSSLGHSATSA